ncbi:MAG: hypothetical protein ABW252_00305 [Polyangiales bacterium]
MTNASHFVVLGLLLAACQHDARALEPRLADVPAWLTDASPACEQCLMTTCAKETEACIDDAACHETFRACAELDPSCNIVSPLHRAYASCYAAACRSACDVEARELSCVGRFDWQPNPTGPIEIELRAVAPTGRIAPSHVEVCSGFESVCEPQSAVTLLDETPQRVPFTPSVPGLTPYFRLTGDELMSMLYFEYLTFPTGYRVNVPQISRRAFEFLMSRIDAPIDTARGTLNLTLSDCTGIGVEGVRFELYRDGARVEPDARTIEYYYEGLLARKPPALAVTRPPLFWGGFVNLTPGLYDVRAYKGELLVGRAAGTVVLADTLTHVTLYPLSRSQQVRP